MSAPLKRLRTVAGFAKKKIVFEGECDARHHRKKRRLQPHHGADCGAFRKGRPPVDTSKKPSRFLAEMGLSSSTT
jgi:hypothetical protein